MDQVGQQITERARSKDGHQRILLNRTADSATAFADVAARLRIAVQSLAHVTCASLKCIPRKIRGALGHVAHRFCGLIYNALRCALILVGAPAPLGVGARSSILCHSVLHGVSDLTRDKTRGAGPRFTTTGMTVGTGHRLLSLCCSTQKRATRSLQVPRSQSPGE